MSVSTVLSIHANNCDFEIISYLFNEGPFAVVTAQGADTGINIYLSTLADAASLARAASEAVKFFGELEAANTENLAEGGERDGDADGPVAPADDEGAEQ